MHGSLHCPACHGLRSNPPRAATVSRQTLYGAPIVTWDIPLYRLFWSGPNVCLAAAWVKKEMVVQAINKCLGNETLSRSSSSSCSAFTSTLRVRLSLLDFAREADLWDPFGECRRFSCGVGRGGSGHGVVRPPEKSRQQIDGDGKDRRRVVFGRDLGDRLEVAQL